VAAALLVQHLHRAGVGGESVTVGSAGVSPAAVTLGASPPEVIAATTPMGLDLREHRSRQLDDDQVAAADLIVTMTRAQLRIVATTHAGSFPRTFTLRELARRLGDGHRLGEAGDDRTSASLLGEDPSDDIPDPFGGPPAAYSKMVATLDPLVATLAEAILGQVGGTT
jgi:protein-tyrosine-phosphatase